MNLSLNVSLTLYTGAEQSWAFWVILNFYIMKSDILFAFSIKRIRLETGYVNGLGPEVDYFYSENDLKVFFLTTQQKSKPKMPSSGAETSVHYENHRIFDRLDRFVMTGLDVVLYFFP